MLSEKSRPVIEATLPLIGSRIGHITPVFYQKMFAAHPELLDGVFNTANQGSGEQPQALAGSIAVFATHLLAHPDTYPETMLSRIAHRHTSLGVTAEQYDIVYEHLFAAIAEDLAEVITAEIADAWTEVYWLMAHALIALERDLYGIQANNQHWAPWRIIHREEHGDSAVTLEFEPADETPVTAAVAGQYVSVRVALPSGLRQARQFTLTGGRGTGRRITVRRDRDGAVSPVLCDALPVGSIVDLSNPYGDVVLATGEHPLILASAGIGSTPTAAILRSLAEDRSTRAVTVLHADRSGADWALQAQIAADIAALESATLRTWMEEPEEGAHSGYMSLDGVDLPADAELYICGPQPFMKSIREQALAAGLPARSIHYEIFGPDVWLPATA